MAAGQPVRGGRATGQLLVDATVAGVIGYGIVALFFLLADVVAGRPPFYAPALLGARLFYGGVAGADVAVEAGPVLAFNGAHLLAFWFGGLFMAWLANLSARLPQGWYLTGTGGLYVVAHLMALPLWFEGEVAAVIPLWSVVLATMMATAGMAGYLWVTHPDVRAAMHEPDEESVSAPAPPAGALSPGSPGPR